MIYRLYRVETIDKAICFYIESTREIDKKREMSILSKIIQAKQNSKLSHSNFIEVGPKLNFVTPWCTNLLQILKQIGFNFITRVEKTILYKRGTEYSIDHVLETIYKDGISTFELSNTSHESHTIESKRIAHYAKKNGLSFDKEDLLYYRKLFKRLNRSPTDVELFDLAQSNSEHSRHCFFNGRLIDVDETELPHSLFDLVKKPLKLRKENSILAFCDNSSAIDGYNIKHMIPIDPTEQSPYQKRDVRMLPTFTAETHNFPTGVSPFPGAATCTGGRIRDNQAIGRGGLIIASIVGYCVGDLHLDGFECDYEDSSTIKKRTKLASAEKIEIEASNGASDYGNKFGEPVISGFTRSFGQTMIRMDTGEKQRIEWIKPIMFSAGVGQTYNQSVTKLEPNLHDHIVRIGGPAYRIGIGGGSASSRSDIKKTDISAVQRGDPEMENKLNRVIRVCVEMGDHNPIRSIHDQGVGGMGNVTKEIIAEGPHAGASIDLDKVLSGDITMSSLELWVSEHQEQDTVLVSEENLSLIQKIAERERVSVCSIGQIDGSGKICVTHNTKTIVDLPLSDVLADLPRKVYHLKPIWYRLREHKLMEMKRRDLLDAIEKVFTILAVGSKRFLVNKVDRSVTGLVAQQQTVGSCQVPISNYSLVAQSYFGYTGVVTAVGEQPIKGLISPEIMSRLCVGEMLCNMMGCVVSRFEDIKCSGNWMWALSGEGEKYRMYTAVNSLSSILCKLGIAIDGGKDSLSMSHQGVNSPGSLVLSGYCTVPDIRNKVDPGFKTANNALFLIDFGGWNTRMGGSAYLQSLNELGKFVPDLNSPDDLKNVFNLVQKLITKKIIKSLHDRSDGGLITLLSEQAFANQMGVKIDLIKYHKRCIKSASSPTTTELLFNEELGVVIEVESAGKLINIFKKFNLQHTLVHLGYVSDEPTIDIHLGERLLVNEAVSSMQMYWELRSFHMEKRQCSLECARDEYSTVSTPKMIDHSATAPIDYPIAEKRIQIAIIREEGVNGDREMAALFYHAGFRPWDVTMSDLQKFTTSLRTLDQFRGVIFPGGFSYADVCGAGRGWASSVLYNKKISEIFSRFKERKDTFSLGVCNGCQLMSNIDWIPGKIRFVKNRSEKFESRCVMVKVCNDKSPFFKGMTNMVLNVWISHGEGNINVPPSDDDLVVLRYVDQNGKPTETYPWNPNGSVGGATGVIDETGRHLAMMPHLERSFLNWQMPYGAGKGDYTQWFKCITNMYEWCMR